MLILNLFGIFLGFFMAGFAILWLYYEIRRKPGQRRKPDYTKAVFYSLGIAVVVFVFLYRLDLHRSDIEQEAIVESEYPIEELIERSKCINSDSTICIYVANFKTQYLHKETITAGRKIAGLIRGKVEKLLAGVTKPPEFQIHEIPSQLVSHLETHNEARDIGKLLNANIVIWGDINHNILLAPLKINPKITIVDPLFTGPVEANIYGLQIARGVIDEWTFYSEKLKEPVALANFIVGLGYYSIYDMERAIKHLNQALARSGKGKGTDILYFYLASAYTDKVFPFNPDSLEAKKVTDALSKAIDINPDQKSYYNNLGLAYEILGKYDDAIKLFHKALSLDSSFHGAKNNLAIMYYAQRNDSLAVATWSEILAEDSSYTAPYINISKTYYYSGNVSGSLEVLKKALRYCPDEHIPIIYSNLGAIYFTLDSIDQSIANSKKAIELKPKYAVSHTNHGAALAKKGEYAKALESHRKALRFNPKLGFIYYNIAAVYAQQGKVIEAVKILDDHFDEINKKYNQLGCQSAFDFLSMDSDFDSIREHWLFKDFLQRHASKFLHQ